MKKTNLVRDLELNINNFVESEQGFYIQMSGIDGDGKIVVSIFDKGNDELILDYSVNYSNDLCEFVDSMKSQLYYNFISERIRYIKQCNSFTKAKVESLIKWQAKGRKDKMEKINKDIIEKYSLIKEMKYELELYKYFNRILGIVKDNMLNEVA